MDGIVSATYALIFNYCFVPHQQHRQRVSRRLWYDLSHLQVLLASRTWLWIYWENQNQKHANTWSERFTINSDTRLRNSKIQYLKMVGIWACIEENKWKSPATDQSITFLTPWVRKQENWCKQTGAEYILSRTWGPVRGNFLDFQIKAWFYSQKTIRHIAYNICNK